MHFVGGQVACNSKGGCAKGGSRRDAEKACSRYDAQLSADMLSNEQQHESSRSFALQLALKWF
jgi:hypothetical protein